MKHGIVAENCPIGGGECKIFATDLHDDVKCGYYDGSITNGDGTKIKCLLTEV